MPVGGRAGGLASSRVCARAAGSGLAGGRAGGRCGLGAVSGSLTPPEIYDKNNVALCPSSFYFGQDNRSQAHNSDERGTGAGAPLRRYRIGIGGIGGIDVQLNCALRYTWNVEAVQHRRQQP